MASSSEAAVAVVRVWEVDDVHPPPCDGATAVTPASGEDRAVRRGRYSPRGAPWAGRSVRHPDQLPGAGLRPAGGAAGGPRPCPGERAGLRRLRRGPGGRRRRGRPRDLAGQTEGEAPREVDAVGGGRIWRLDNSVEAGGGVCGHGQPRRPRTAGGAPQRLIPRLHTPIGYAAAGGRDMPDTHTEHHAMPRGPRRPRRPRQARRATTRSMFRRRFWLSLRADDPDRGDQRDGHGLVRLRPGLPGHAPGRPGARHVRVLLGRLAVPGRRRGASSATARPG